MGLDSPAAGRAGTQFLCKNCVSARGFRGLRAPAPPGTFPSPEKYPKGRQNQGLSLFLKGSTAASSAAPRRQGSTRGAAPPTPQCQRGGDEARPAMPAANEMAARGAPPKGAKPARPAGRRSAGRQARGEARRPPLLLSTSCPGPAAPSKGHRGRGGRGAPEGRSGPPGGAAGQSSPKGYQSPA